MAHEMIPAARALIGWTYELHAEKLLVAQVVVVDNDQALIDGTVDHELWGEPQQTAGACLYGWSANPRPMHLFASLCVEGFVSNADLQRAVREFSKIDTCDWARFAFATRE